MTARNNTTGQDLYSMEAEQAVLGAVLLRPQVLDDLVDWLPRPEAFYHQAHSLIYQAMLDLWGRGEPIDLVTVTTLLKERGQLDKAGGPGFLAGIGDQVGTAANATYYARLVRDKAALRRFRNCLVSLLHASGRPVADVQEFLNRAEADIYQAARLEEVREEPQALMQVMTATLEEIDAQRRDKLPPGISTEYYDLDARIGGLEPQNLYVLAARPGMGKTALALNIAMNIARAGHPVLFLSLETSKAQLARRLLAEAASLPHQRLRDGIVDEEDWQQVKKAARRLDLPLYLDDRGALTHLELRARARRAAARWRIKLLVVDYLQLVSAPEAKSREQEVAALSRHFKALAKELNIPVLVLAQLNRACEARSDKRPVLSDLRESGAIEQDADVVMFIYRDEYYRKIKSQKGVGVAEILVRKNRHGSIGTVKLSFQHEMVVFRNLAKDEPPF